jgi:polysaccharide deacetylase 2 family uncharacterized protein YibQ
VIRRFFSFVVSRVAPWAIILLNVGFLVFVALLLFVFQEPEEPSQILAQLDTIAPAPAQKDTEAAAPSVPPSEEPEKDTLPPSFSAEVAQDLVERSPFGFLPKRGTADRTPWQVYARSDLWPKTPPYATVSLVVEQMGMNATLLDQAKTVLPARVALAFNPYAEEVFSQMQNARQGGFETLLSLAMETRNYPYSDPGSMALMTGNLPEKNQEMMLQQLATAQGYMGMIPMMGKIARYDAPVMDLILSQMTARGLMYVDAAEGTQATVNEKRWKNDDLPYTRVTLRLESIEARDAFFKTLAQTALKQGSAVGILPPYPIVFESVKAWVKRLPQTHPQLSFVPLSYQGRLFLDAPKPEPEPAPTAEDPKKDEKNPDKQDDKKDKKDKKDEAKPKPKPKPKPEGGGH